jgi:tetratricopeptide (TPR) repeat protein
MPGVHGAVAELLADAGQLTEAEESYRRELAITPQNARVNYRYGLVLGQLGNTKDAIRYLSRAVSVDPSLVDAHLNLGKALLQEGKLELAEKSLKQVIHSDASNEIKSTAHYQLALLYRKLGRTAEAAQHTRSFNELKAR